MYSDNRLSKFEKVVFSDASEKANGIISEANQTAEKIVKDAQKKARKITNEMLLKSTAKFQKQYAFETANSAFCAKRELILKRTEFTDDLFQKVKEKLINFTKTDDYKNYLISVYNTAKNEYKSDAEIECSKSDEALCKEIFEEKIKPCDDIKVGGVRIVLESEKVIIDKTFDEALKDEKAEFIKRSGLTID